MDPLKRLEEAVLQGLRKEEYFHLMEMEVKLMEMRREEVSAASMSTPRQSGTDLQQTLLDIQHQQIRQHEKVCHGIKLIVKQLHQLQQDQQDQRHQRDTQISELYRNVDSRLESSVQQLKEELHELRVEVLNKVEGSRSYLRDTLVGAKGVKASVFNKIGEVTNSLKGNLHDVRKDIFSRVATLEGDFFNFENDGGREPRSKQNENPPRVLGNQTREKSTSVAQFEDSQEFTNHEEHVEGMDNLGKIKNEAAQKLNGNVESKRVVQDAERTRLGSDRARLDGIRIEHSNPNQMREPLVKSDALDNSIVVSPYSADMTSRPCSSRFKEQTETVPGEADHLTKQSEKLSDLSLETVDALSNSNILPVDLTSRQSLPGSHVGGSDQTDGDETMSQTSGEVKDMVGPPVAGQQEDTTHLEDEFRPQDTSVLSNVSSRQDETQTPNTPSPEDMSPTLNASSQQDASQSENMLLSQDKSLPCNASSSQDPSTIQPDPSLRAIKDRDDTVTNFVQHLEVLERLFYVITQQSHQLFLNTVEDKMEQTLNAIVTLTTGVKHEICDVTEKEMQLVRDRLSGTCRPRKHYVCDFYVKNFRSMVNCVDSQISHHWHIDQMRSCVKGYVEFTRNGDMYVALMYGRHPSALGLAPRAGIKLKVKATVKDTMQVLPDLVVGEVTWNCNETGVKDNRAWGKKIGVLSCGSLVNQGYGEKEGYAYGSMLIRYDITVLKESSSN